MSKQITITLSAREAAQIFQSLSVHGNAEETGYWGAEKDPSPARIRQRDRTLATIRALRDRWPHT